MNQLTRRFFRPLLAAALWLAAGHLASADEVLLKNDLRIQGTIRWEGTLGPVPGSETLEIPLSTAAHARIHGDRVLFVLEDGRWVECTLLSPDLTLEKNGIWHIVRADTVREIRLTPREEIIALVPGEEPPGRAAPPTAGEPAVAAAGPVTAGPAEEPWEPTEALPPLPGEQPGAATAMAPPAEGTLVQKGPVPVRLKPPAEKKKRFLGTVQAGYVSFLGNDADILGGGAQYGFSLGYELLQEGPWFLGPEITFLRSSHTGKGFLQGVTQNVNTLGFGARGGYSLASFDLYGRLDLGPVILDASGGPNGKSGTFFGFQFSVGFEYRLLPWLSMGPEMQLGTIAGKTSTLSGMGRISLRF